MTIDIDAYIASLPVRELRPPRPDAPTRFLRWRWPLSKPFNGFSGVERVRGWQLSVWLERAGSLTRPTQCDICGSEDRVAFHSETYFHVGRAPALCSRCHRALHRRQIEWREWRAIVEPVVLTGREWFALAPRYGLDIAAHLRAQWGRQVADLLCSPFWQRPIIVPDDLMPHPDLGPLSSIEMY